MAKDKKKDGKKKDKAGAAGSGALGTLKALGSNKLVNDVVAAALVATAAALKDSDKARRLASAAGDELEKMSKDAADRGSAMWKLALDVGRRALDSVNSEAPKAKRAKASAGAKPAGKAKSKARTAKPRAKAGTKSASAKS